MRYALATLFLMLAVLGQPATQPSTQPSTQPDEKAARDALIDRLQKDGIFGTIRTANNVGKVEVGGKFMNLPFEDKQRFASVAYAWCVDQDEKCALLVLKDFKTGKQVGRFSRELGGLVME